MEISLQIRFSCGIILQTAAVGGGSAFRPPEDQEEIPMKHIQTLNGATLKASAAKGGCGECQTSCQSACKTSCTVANQKCENQ